MSEYQRMRGLKRFWCLIVGHKWNYDVLIEFSIMADLLTGKEVTLICERCQETTTKKLKMEPIFPASYDGIFLDPNVKPMSYIWCRTEMDE